MRVTFDTNTYRPVVEPDQYVNDPDHAIYRDLNQAIRDGRITPFIGEALFTVEAIRRVASALSGKPEATRRNGGIDHFGRMHQSQDHYRADHARHPGLSTHEIDRLERLSSSDWFLPNLV